VLGVFDMLVAEAGKVTLKVIPLIGVFSSVFVFDPLKDQVWLVTATFGTLSKIHRLSGMH
jgi:hypothetical protein